MWLLNFLLDNASRVLSLVSYYYNRIIDAARNAFTWARNEANKAYWRAISFAQSVLALAKNFSTTLFNTLVAFVNAVNNNIRALIASTRAFVIALIGIAETRVRNFLIAWIEGVKAGIIKFVNQVNTALDKAFRAGLELALKPYKWLITNRQAILDLLEEFTIENRRKIITFLREDWPMIRGFLINPVGYVIAVLRGFLLDVLSWSLAYSLGTVAATLPPWPDFLKGVPGGGNPGPTGPPPGSGGLVAPLTSLRISGNTYGQGHPGVDLGCARGQSVGTMHNGVIEESGFSGVGFGWTVTVRGGVWWTRYAHFDKAGLPKGTNVLAGQVVGACGSSGNSTGNHLHLEIKHNGLYVSPVTILGLAKSI